MPAAHRDPKYVAILALASALILIVGNWLKPERNESDGSPNASPSEIQRLQQLTNRRSIENISTYFADLASEVEPFVLRVSNPGGSSILWSPTRLIAAAGEGRFPDRVEVRGPSGDVIPAETTAAGPHLPLVELREESTLRPFGARLRRAAARGLPPGAWALAVWRQADGLPVHASGRALSSKDVTCGDAETRAVMVDMALDASMRGGGLFDLDGALVAVIAPCEGRWLALEARVVDEIFPPEDALEHRMLRRYGMRVSQLKEAEYDLFNSDYGMVVRETWRSHNASEAGLLPGDVIIQVDGMPVTASDDLELLTLPVAREVFDLTLLREGKEQNVALHARAAVGGDAAVKLGVTNPGLLMARISPDSAAARGGARSGDRLIMLAGKQPQAGEELIRALAGGEDRRQWAVFGRNGRMWGAFL